jgi:hypothetical protein
MKFSIVQRQAIHLATQSPLSSPSNPSCDAERSHRRAVPSIVRRRAIHRATAEPYIARPPSRPLSSPSNPSSDAEPYIVEPVQSIVEPVQSIVRRRAIHRAHQLPSPSCELSSRPIGSRPGFPSQAVQASHRMPSIANPASCPLLTPQAVHCQAYRACPIQSIASCPLPSPSHPLAVHHIELHFLSTTFRNQP